MEKEIKRIVIEFEDGTKKEVIKGLCVELKESNDITTTLDDGIKDINDKELIAIAYDLNDLIEQQI